jgi:hypothetical protein
MSGNKYRHILPSIVVFLAAMLVALLATLLVFSCHLFEDYSVNDTVALFFNETNVSVFEGGLGSVSLRVEASSVLENNNVLYDISNEEIASIYRADKRG